MPHRKDPNSKRYKPPTAFRIDEDLLNRVRAYCQSHHLKPTHTAVFEAALREWLDNHEDEARPRKAA